jgi:tRNA A37 threonylcarbamoyladenosine synthetase subunit TsaC/SUA5/YrdC
MRLDGHDPAAIESAAERLAAGELVAFATETVYGLGAAPTTMRRSTRSSPRRAGRARTR